MATKAKYYTPTRDDAVLCELCPHNCLIMTRKTGKCRVRTNRNGILYSDTYGKVSATHFDPIEKKPLYNFFPGSEIFSIGSLGCNFRCSCCQNYEIAQSGVAGFPRLQELSVDEVVNLAQTNSANIGVAYTYNEPFVWYEFMYDIAVKAKAAGLKNVVVSNGYINPEPLKELLPLMDAFNIDIKTFDLRKYKEFAGGDRPWVLNALSMIKEAGCHLELTMLVVPGVSDDISLFKEMLNWIKEKLGTNVPLHLSRYFPQYKYDEPPTPREILLEMAELAAESLDYVYMGNIPDDKYQQTFCPDCGTMVIRRQGYYTERTHLDGKGCCKSCGYEIARNL